MKKVVLAVAVLCTCLTVSAGASSLSPAVGILAKRMELKRCTAQNSELEFDEDVFLSYFGEKTDDVVAKILPGEECGTLYCGSFAVKEGQTLSADSLSMLKFLPCSEFSGVAEMTFVSGEKTLLCSVLVTKEKNKSPVTGNQSVATQKNIALIKAFSAADPENDRLEYEIVKYPSKGNVSVNNADGIFVYRPEKDYVGRDSFAYRATDVFGNTSKTRIVKINVSKSASDVYFSDMENHWAHNSAVKMAATGLMSGEKVDDKYVFSPDKAMTRGDFLALTLICSGLEKSVPFTEKTSFADDKNIPSNIKSYVEYAYRKGIISGYKTEDGEICFNSPGAVTRAEAAVIACKTLEICTENDKKSGEEKKFTDASAIPSWASEGIEKLSAMGILKGSPSGKISAEKTLTRAEGAEMICSVADYVESRKKEEKDKKSFFDFFDIFKREKQ